MEQFVTCLKVLSKDCSFNDTYTDDMIRDRLVLGIRSQYIRKKLLTVDADLTLAKAIQICQTYEYAQEQLKTMTSTAGANMGAVTAAVSYVNKRPGSNQNQRMKPKATKLRGPAKGTHSNPGKQNQGTQITSRVGTVAKNMEKARTLQRHVPYSVIHVRNGTILRQFVDQRM
ncbi:MAG: hypothetical protein AB2705_19885 [Candidatus Thiodiazotropha sp.]